MCFKVPDKIIRLTVRLIRPFNCPSEVIKLSAASKSRLATVNIPG